MEFTKGIRVKLRLLQARRFVRPVFGNCCNRRFQFPYSGGSPMFNIWGYQPLFS